MSGFVAMFVKPGTMQASTCAARPTVLGRC